MIENPDPLWIAVRQQIAETLGHDEEMVTREANWFSDLQGESIDLLDLGFRCEKAFGVSVQFKAAPQLTWQLDEQGRLTPDSRRQIVDVYPALAGRLPETEFHWHQLFAIENIFQLVKAAVDKKALAKASSATTAEAEGG